MLITLRDIGPSKTSYAEEEFLSEIRTKKVLKVFLFLFTTWPFQIHATSYSSTVQLLYTVEEKGRNHTPSLWSKNSYTETLKSENSQDYAQKPQGNCTFMNSASVCSLRSTGPSKTSSTVNLSTVCTTTPATNTCFKLLNGVSPLSLTPVNLQEKRLQQLVKRTII